MQKAAEAFLNIPRNSFTSSLQGLTLDPVGAQIKHLEGVLGLLRLAVEQV
jgi:hypothetical protein